MSSSNDYIIRRFSGIVLLILFINSHQGFSQRGILDSVYTFRAGPVKTGYALDMISKQTGFYFAYDTKLINTNQDVDFSFSNLPLRKILDSLLQKDSLRYSVIDKYIIIYRIVPPPVPPDTISNWQVRNITGVIKDSETGEPLPFATIGIISKGRGTVTNSNGEFNLKITRSCINDTLSVSYLGYFNKEIAVRQGLARGLNIKMTRQYISIPEIIIRNQVPQEIILKSYKAISQNYGSSPARLTAFYREAVIKKTKLQIYSEAILELYKSAYTGSFFSDQIKVIKSRKLENLGLKDTLTIRLKAGLSSCLLLDGARHPFDFILPENYDQYDYHMTDIVTIDDESAYVIDFVQKPEIKMPLFKGSVYINTLDYAIVQAEFEINPDYIQKTKGDVINYQARNYNMWPTSIKYTVSYRKINDRYFLNHVRGDLDFSARQKGKLFNTAFNVFFELAVTDINMNNVTRFDREETSPTHSVFSRTIPSYDPVFWENQDFLKPEDNLLHALKNMKVRLQEYSK
jgi:hypothetical protein